MNYKGTVLNSILFHSSGVLSGSHSFGHGGSQSDLTNNEETQSHDPLSASYDPPTESHDPLSASYDPPTESHDLFADLPFGWVHIKYSYSIFDRDSLGWLVEFIAKFFQFQLEVQ